MKNKNIKNNGKSMKMVMATSIALLVAAGFMFTALHKSNSIAGTVQVEETKTEIQSSKDGDLIIPVADVTENASFYGYEIDGTTIEVLAIKAEDGSIRTAFNTCQVCYDSGRGYYKQEGDDLVCQNCGNRFSASDVEVSKGGCNPVPIFSENKTVDNTNITISKDFLAQAKVIFDNWKA